MGAIFIKTLLKFVDFHYGNSNSDLYSYSVSFFDTVFAISVSVSVVSVAKA